jgi:hypothetical protein
VSQPTGGNISDLRMRATAGIAEVCIMAEREVCRVSAWWAGRWRRCRAVGLCGK